jgi:polygalacturonase
VAATAIRCDVKAFGAHGDGKTKDTAALQAAIDSCAKNAGTVALHDGTFLSGTLYLKSGITLQIDPTATLKGTRDDADYPTLQPPTENSQLLNCRKALLYAEGVTNLHLQGTGTIDGSGGNPNWTQGCQGHSCKEATRPMAIFIALSSNVSIEDLHVKDAAMWGVVNMETDNLIIRGLHVHSPFGPTRDGIDIVDCHHVLIENTDVFSEDDSFCLKSGSAKGVYDVTIRNSQVLQSIVANALKLGTASTGSFKKVLFQNITIQGADKAAMAVESVDGATIDGVRFENIQFHQAGAAAFVLLGKRGSPPAVGSIRNISFENITGDTKHTWGSAISGTIVDGKTYAPEAISFNQVHVKVPGGVRDIPGDPPEYQGQYPDPNLWGNLPAYGYFVRHIRGMQFKDSSVDAATPDMRESFVQKDVRDQQSE